MKYCLAVGIHTFYFDLAIVDSNHQIVGKKVCKYNKSMDIANTIYSSYKMYFKEYKISYVGVGVVNTITFKDNIIYNLNGVSRYNITSSLNKLFKKDVYVLEDSQLAGLAMSYRLASKSLLYLILDHHITNSYIIDHDIVVIEDDINILKGNNIDCCKKEYLKSQLLKNGLDDEIVGIYFYSSNEKVKEIFNEWGKNLSSEISRIFKVLNVKDIAFAGYMGQYYDDFKDCLKLPKNVNCFPVKDNRENVLIGVSHLIFKDK